MKLNTIVNNPKERRKSTPYHIYWYNTFTEDELVSIENLFDSYERERASITGAETGSDVAEQIRKSEVAFVVRDDNTSWIFDRFNLAINSMNNEFYGFDLNGYEKIQYTVYDSSYQGKFNWHMDTIMGGMPADSFDETRKLTLIMLLNEPGKDFTGGEFEITDSDQQNPIVPEMHRGTIIALPSYMIHRVKPVQLGVRKSVVIWVEGPKFR